MESIRTIFHIDFDSFFASVEQQEHPELRGKPVFVTGSTSPRAVVTAVSREAKPSGARSGMNLPEAKRFCPDAIVVPGDHQKYVWYADRFFAILSEYTEDVEVASIDEVFIDATAWQTLRENPEHFIDILKIRLVSEFGPYVTCSAGIGANKFVAKVASASQKPNGCVRVPRGGEAAFITQRTLASLPGIGKATQMKLAERGITTVSELQQTQKRFLVEYFGSYGEWLHERAWGRDNSPVVPFWNTPDPKSIGHATTFPRDITDRGEIETMLLALAERVGERLREQQMVARVVRVQVRFSNFKEFNKQTTLALAVDDGATLARIGATLMPAFPWPVRLVGVTAGGLEHARQATLFTDELRRTSVFAAIDRLNQRFGRGAIRRARLTGKILPHTKPSGFH
ncbi:MAG: DNA polymerase IV [bacterium]|nr:DNA polymerase IV [bacterium]